jgi:protoporphyrinogen oxidase/uncharacterized protein YndB with AHSA1/START domain
MKEYDVVIVGAGFTGLTAAYELAKAGHKVLVLEQDSAPGGLAGTFHMNNGVVVEKFYHHWFNNDVYVPELVKELGLEERILTLPSRTGMYFNGKLWRLSKPLDLLRFTPLSFINRIRLGLLVFQVRLVRDWRKIEHLSIKEWLEPLCGKKVFQVVWEPLIKSKFSVFAEHISAVWLWKKLVLRGGTRNSKGDEQLLYFRGGFGKLAEELAAAVQKKGGEVRYNTSVTTAHTSANKVTHLSTSEGEVRAKEFLFTPAYPVIAGMFEGQASRDWLIRLRRVRYLGNICLVLMLDRSLSDTYWLNVNDPGFPFVGVIEHTNLDNPEHYKGRHIVYLSRYLAVEDPVWAYGDEAYLDFALQHLKRMFPEFERSWVKDSHIWRAEFAQAVTERNYSTYVPGLETPFVNAKIATMAQVYPEDRGTNYAIRDGRAVAQAYINASTPKEELMSEFVITRTFNVSRERMWNAWTQPEQISQWFGPKGSKGRIVKFDLRPGGMQHYSLSNPQGPEMWGKAIYEEVTKPEKLVWVQSFSDPEGGITRHPLAPNWPREMHTVMTLAEKPGNQTEVTIRWTPVNPTPEEQQLFDSAMEGMRGGWTGSFDVLDEFLKQSGKEAA